MHRLIVLCALATTSACRPYFDNDGRLIPLGCVNGIDGLTPWEPTRINTLFIVHDKDHIGHPHRLLLWNTSFNPHDAMFKPEDKLQLIIHGFAASSQKAWVQKLKDAFIQKDHRTKVLLVDWSDGAFEGKSSDGEKFRLQGANNALIVGRVVACFIERIISTYGVQETSVRIFGHSMGGQIMGLAVGWLSEKFCIRIGVGTASEASAQPFISKGIYPNNRNVHFMLAMHTASAAPGFENRAGARGLYQAFADVDLYANRGTLIQPACRDSSFYLCSHERAPLYLTEMVTDCDKHCDFRGLVCANASDALNGTCSDGTVNVCLFIRNHEANADDSKRRGTVLSFKTHLDKLPINCT